MTFAIYTLGCKVNYYESTAIAEALTEKGLFECDFDEISDIYIINTCAVTAESERKAGQMIRRARKKNPDAYVIVTGCMAQISPKKTALTGADYICGNKEKLRAVKAALDYAAGLSERKQILIEDDLANAPFENMTIRHSDRTRAYIKIGDGCESRCAYCVIKKARGPVRSKSAELVMQEARGLVARGYREIVLTAIEISAYGKDLENTDLADLIVELDSIDRLTRIRLGSLDPAILKENFVGKIASAKALAPHFHLSLQSGCDKTLAAMRRKYNTSMVKEAVRLLRRAFPDAMFTADVIVGFPGESEEDFLASAEFISSLDLLHAHIFAFSPRPGTEAADMPDQISKEIKNRRSAYLSSLCELARDRCLDKYVGRVMPVLFEELRDGHCFGHTANFIEVALPCSDDLHSRTLDIKLTHHENGIMFGKLI